MVKLTGSVCVPPVELVSVRFAVFTPLNPFGLAVSVTVTVLPAGMVTGSPGASHTALEVDVTVIEPAEMLVSDIVVVTGVVLPVGAPKVTVLVLDVMGFAAAFTVNVALFEVVVPLALVTLTAYTLPFMAVLVTGVV